MLYNVKKEIRMYNKKSKISAILALITVALLIALMILLPFLRPYTEETDDPEANLGAGIGAFFSVLLGIIGYIVFYIVAIPFVIVGLVYGIKMLKQQSRKKLILFNRGLLITTCVMLPILVVGMIISSALVFNSTFGVFPVIHTVLTAVAYIAGLIAQGIVLAQLKKMPEETAPTETAH